MAYDNRPYLNSQKFDQKGCDYLYLAGQNCICSGGTMSSNSGYKISGSTIFNTGNVLNMIQIGCNSSSTGIASVAIGASAHSVGITSVAVGCNSWSCGNGSVSLGTLSRTNGCYAISVGCGSCAMYDNSISIGGNAITTNLNGISIGDSANSGLNGITIGSSSYSANNSITIGFMACTIGNSSVAIGSYAGYCQTNNNRLYIANSSGCTLICGEFDNKVVKIDGKLCSTTNMYACNFILSSDVYKKTCISNITLSRINVDYKQFELIAEPNQLRYGVIAQELQKENPELIRIDENGMLGVAYIDLLVREIAYLKYRIEQLENKLN